ncbi:hypothetical protein E2C01_051451 [Portunus trituberculatus]|uniref:Transposase Tc1-like domain-containing protein n=1 Tax=Portunus trituberculatus TaxID=210409 RepID=A0A5B7GBM9_PORTR|nr:hypothetical protein [Portunus trituberculatus]
MPISTTSRDKWKEVFTLYKAGHNLPFISNKTSVKLRTTQHLVEHFKEMGEGSALASLPMFSRPRKTTLKTHVLISRQVAKEPRLTAQEIKEKKPQLLEHVSVRSVQDILHNDLGHKCYCACKKPLLTALQKKRVKFCKKYLVWRKK